jgi:RNA polymerase-binding transcription factor DksA
MATKERHTPRAGQAPERPGPAKDPAWAGLAPEPAQAGHAQGPVWRALREARWRDQVQEVTELSLAYHEAASAAAAAAAGGAPANGLAERKVRKLLRRTVAARRALADTEEALDRLVSGRYGLCEGCTEAIPARLLAAAPEARYCQRCRPRPTRASAMAVRPAGVYLPVQARSSRSSVSAMTLAQILPLSMPTRSSSGAREQS